MTRHPPNSPLFPSPPLSHPPDEPLQLLVARRALATEGLPVAMAPDDAGRKEHRAAEPRALLGDDGLAPELPKTGPGDERSEEHTSELQSQSNLVCRLLLEKK